MIKIMTDMAADIPKATAIELGIEILPFMITVDGNEIIADINLLPEDFYKLADNCAEPPTTAQMSPSDLEDVYRKLGKENTVIHVTISANASGINNTAQLVAAQLNAEGFDITVIDSTMLSLPIGKPCIAAAEMARNGAEKKEIIDFLVAEYARDTAYFLVDDLTFLRKGGRIKATAMAISKVLDIKPILTINDGLVEAFRKVRTLKKALSALVDFIDERMDSPQENELVLLHSNAPDKIEMIEAMVKERINPKSIVVMNIGPVITSHAGTGLVGVYFKHKKPYTEYENK